MHPFTHRLSTSIFLLQENLKAFSKRGDSVSAGDPVGWTQQQSGGITVQRELNSKARDRTQASQISTCPLQRASFPTLKRLARSTTSQFTQVETPSSPQGSPITHWKAAITFPKKCMSLDWLKHSSEAHEEELYKSCATGNHSVNSEIKVSFPIGLRWMERASQVFSILQVSGCLQWSSFFGVFFVCFEGV